jgi:hypothetical protein
MTRNDKTMRLCYNRRMSMLGLDGAPHREENFIKRMFWPANQPYAVDSLGQQGLWVCLAVAIISTVVSVVSGHPFIALLVLLFYWTGGMGVREHSMAAAVLLTMGYLGSVLMVVLLGGLPGILDVLIAGLLLANIRGTYIASSWKKRAEPDSFPERLNSTFTDKLIDQWPARFWPKGRFAFFAVAAIYASLFVLGVVGTMRLRAQQRLEPQENQLQVTLPGK